MDDFERLWSELGSHGVMVLSTCAGSRVTSRSMSVVIFGGKFCFQTNKDYLKSRQISDNPNVALCFGKFSIEGSCKMLGHPEDESEFMDNLSRAYPDAVKRWSSLPYERVFAVTPRLIRSWIYENDIPYIEEWDLVKKTYRKERQ